MASSITLYMPDYASVRWIECSPPSWMVLLALEEKGLEYEVETLSFAAGEHKSPEMLARNPRGTIPVLTDGAYSLYETYAIFEYLEYIYPDPPLMPATEDARVCAILRLHESSNLKSVGMALFAYIMHNPREEWDHPHVDGMKAALHKELLFWEGYAAQSPWMAGDRLSYADFSVFAYIATCLHLGLMLEPEFPALGAFVSRMRSRPSVDSTWPTLWLENQYDFL